VSSDAALLVSGVTVYYGGVVLALEDVTISVPQGQCHAVLGANGAGKSTLLKAVSGVLADEAGTISTGSISFEGNDITRQSAARRYRQGIVHVLEGRRLLPHLSVHRNLFAGANRLSRRNAQDAVLSVYERIPALSRMRSQPAGQLSGGQQQLVVIARAIVAEPTLLLIDEPSLGLAPKMAEDIYDTLAQLMHPQMTMVIVEQNVTLARQIADSTTVLELGRITAEHASGGIQATDELVSRYLGGEQADSPETALRPARHSSWAQL
jgi:branched-chain amino acid transport system ATP-binding protein